MAYSSLIIYFLIFIFLFSLLFFIGLKNSGCDWNHTWLNSIDGWLRLFCRFYHRLEYQKIPLPETGDAIIASNHISGLDPLLLIAVTTRPIRFLIAREEYNRFGLTWLFRAGGCIPIDRSGNVTRAMSAVIQALDEGEIVAIFPEGVIHKQQQPIKPLKRGIALLAQVTNSIIYPVHISGVRGQGHVLRGVLYPSKVSLTIGKKIACHNDEHEQCLQKISKILHPG